VADIPEPTVWPTAYAVSCLPEDDPAWCGLFVITVVRRAPDSWAVVWRGRCLSAIGEWDWEQIPSERTDDWKVAHRFDLDTALHLARNAAPLLKTNGHTVAQAREAAGYA
jgi:hypothetical protein